MAAIHLPPRAGTPQRISAQTHKKNQALGGLPKPGLTVIAGRPGMGATTLALSIAANATIDLGISTALFSIESSEAQLAQRFVAMRARIPIAELRRGSVAEQRWPKILRASQQLAAAPLWVDDSPQLELPSVFSRIERLKDEHSMRLIIIDSIHGLTTNGRPSLDPTSIAATLFGLRAAARQLDVSIIVTMEVSGHCENRVDKRPQLRDSPATTSLPPSATSSSSYTGTSITTRQARESAR
jgi:replicative DNA helicase